MKRSILTFFLTFAVSAVSLAENAEPSAQKQPSADAAISAHSESIPIKDLPPAVQQRVQRQAALLPLKKITKQMQGGQTIYEASFAGNNASTILQLREDGSPAGMRVVSSAPVVVEKAGAQRPAQTATATTSATQPAQNSGFTYYPATQGQQPTAQSTNATGGGVTGQLPQPSGQTGGGITGQLPPTPGSKDFPGTGVTGQVLDQSAGAQNPTSAQLPAEVQSAIQQQIGSGQIESAQGFMVYQVNVRGANGQPQTIWIDSYGRVLQQNPAR